MTGLAFLGLLTNVEKKLRAAQNRMERYKSTLEYIHSLHSGTKVMESRDVAKQESRMLRYMEAVDNVADLTDQKNSIIDMIEEKLAMLQTINGEEIIRARYIDYESISEIAERLHYSRQGAYKLLDRAMIELDEILKNVTLEDIGYIHYEEADEESMDIFCEEEQTVQKAI